MLHARRQIIWIEDTTTLMPVQAAHNLAAIHYARDSRLKLQANGGKIPDGSDSDGGKDVKELSKWSTAHPMASVSSVLMQSVEPLEDFAAGVTELMPNPTAPSAAEVRLVLARRRMLDRERAQHAQTAAGNDTSSQAHQEQPRIPSGGGHGVVNQGMLTPNALVDKPRTKTVEFEDKPGKNLPQGTADTTGCQGVTESSPARDSSIAATAPPASELVQEASQDSRLVLPVLESLIALRRSRLTRPTQPAQQPPQSPHPPVRPSNMSINGGGGCGGTAAGDVATWYGASGTPSPGAAAKPTGAKTTRRFGANTVNTNANTNASGAAAAATAPPQLPLQSDLMTAQADEPAAAATPPASAAVGSSRPQMMFCGPNMMQPPTLSQFPGPFRSTRRWEVFLPDGPCGPPVSGVVGGAPVTPSGAFFSATARTTGASATATVGPGSSCRACGVSWAGSEAPLERATVALSSPTYGSKLAAPASTGAAAAPPAVMFSPVIQVAVTAAGRSSDASVSVCHTSRISPRTSIELGLASSTDGGPEDSGGMLRSVARQRALLQEWQEWRERGSLGPPPGIDEETDCSGDGVAAAAVAAGSKDMDDDDEEGTENEDDGCGLLLGLASGRRPADKPAAPAAVTAAAAVAAAAAAAAAGHGDDDDNYDESPKSGQWRRSRRITQSFDLLGLEGLSVPASMPKTSMSAPLGLVLTPTSPAGPPPPAVLSGMSAPSAAPSPSAAQGLGAAVPLSPMAMRRRGDKAHSARSGVGSLALPMWLNKAFGGATTAVAPMPMPMPMPMPVPMPPDEANPCDDGGGHGDAPSAPTPAPAPAPAPAPVATSSRIPSLANAKHLSFTSKFNRFRERIQSFSLVHPAPAIEVNLMERAKSMMGGGAAGLQTRVAVSNDGRTALLTPSGPGIGGAELPQQQQQQQQQPMVRQTQSRKGPPGSSSGAYADLSIRAAGRGSMDAAASRVSNRHSLDSRLSNSKGRNPTGESSMPKSPAATVGGGTGQQLQQGLHEAFVLTNSVDRSRRGDPSVHQVPGLLPPVRLL